MGSALKFNNTAVPRQDLERARLKVVQGPDYGSVWVLTGTTVSIGRGEDNDVIVTDLKASRRHAEIMFLGNGWQVRDTGSANGISHNGKNLRHAMIRSGDLVTIGETILEFVIAEAGTRALLAAPRNAGQLLAENAAFEAQRQRVQSLGRSGGSRPRPVAAPTPKVAGSGGRQKLLVVGGLAIAALLLMPGEDKKPVKNAKGKTKATGVASDIAVNNDNDGRTIASIEPDPEAPAVINQSAEMFFRAGFREFRERNYLRARQNFENVLSVQPNHLQARKFAESCNQAIKEEVSFHLVQGKKTLASGKLRIAKGHFEAVMRLLNRDPTSPDFIEAKDQLNRVEKELKGETG